jgi:hypothetical protein
MLGPGKKWIVAVFQDESCFYVNEYKRTIWCIPTFLSPREGPYDLGKDETRLAKAYEEGEGISYLCLRFC